MKIKKKTRSGSLRVEPSVLADTKKICKQKGILVSFYATEALKEKNQKETVK
jgi:hypothetical protein